MLFDEYAIHEWPGETMVVDVDEYFTDKPNVRAMTLSWTSVPAGHFIKE